MRHPLALIAPGRHLPGHLLLTLSVLLCGHAQAQDQTQRTIASKIVQAFPSTQVVPCPEQYERSLKLGKSICLLDPGKTSNRLFSDIKERFKGNLVSLDTFRFVAWKTSTRVYPIRQYNYLPVIFISVQDAVPTATPPALPTGYRPTQQAARAAGSTPGATYARLDDVKPLTQVTARGNELYFNKKGHTVHLTVGKMTGTLNGKPIQLTGKPFRMGEVIYVPAGSMRSFGCDVQGTYGQVDSGYLNVTCTTATGTRSHVIPTWRF